MSKFSPDSYGDAHPLSGDSWALLLSRVATIERALVAEPRGTPANGRSEAQQEAHKLAGSLDMFGYRRAGELAGELEHSLSDGDPSGRAHELALELRHEMEQARQEPTSNRPGHTATVGASSARILVADDDEIMARMIVSALERQAYNVVRARNGAEAVEMSRRETFDLVLLDLQMPVMDGFSACRALRTDPRLAEVPVILVTAQSNEQAVRDRNVEGASDYLIKPFAVADLRSLVRSWLAIGVETPSA